MNVVVRIRLLLVVAVLLVCLPRLAYADGFVNAGLGISFGSPSTEGRANFVAGSAGCRANRSALRST